MNKTELNNVINIEGKALDEALFFIIAHQARNLIYNSTNYKVLTKRFNENLDNRALARLQCVFHIDKGMMLEMIPHSRIRLDGKQIRISGKIIDWVKKNSKYLNYIGKKDVTYTSGKKFSHLSFWLLKANAINMVFNDSSVNIANSHYYSQLAHNIIDGHILNKGGILARLAKANKLKYEFKQNTNKLNGDDDMTKAQKEQYQKEYEEGLHSLSLKELEAEERKKKRRADKHRMTIAKKAVKATLAEYAKLQLENQQLKAELEHIKSLKDVNSDIVEPKVDEPKETIPVASPNDGIPGEDPEDKWMAKHNENLTNQLKLAVENGLIKWTKGNEFALKLDLDVSFTFKSQRGYSYNKMTDVIEKKFNNIIDRQKCSHIEETSELDDTTTIDEE